MFALYQAPKVQRSKGIALLIRDLRTRRGGWLAPRPGRFTPWKDAVPIVQEAGWALGPVWTCAGNLASTGIGSSDCPAKYKLRKLKQKIVLVYYFGGFV
jgi:hypothetical protein